MCPTVNDRTLVKNENRKPGPGMLLRAATDLGLDLPASWMVGDLISDVLAGLNAGCRSILVKSGPEPHDGPEDEALSGRYLVLSRFRRRGGDNPGRPAGAPVSCSRNPRCSTRGAPRHWGQPTSWMIHRSRPERLRRSELPIWPTSIR